MFVELDRTFHELSKRLESDGTDIDQWSTIGPQLGWPDLIREYRVVILSEAGAGKTEEIRNAARRLRTTGKAAFFVRLEYAAREFESAFEEGTYEEFEMWMTSDNDGWLLLDSVDEARLRHSRDFEDAIRTIGQQLTNAKQRVHIVITGRTSAWRPNTDLALCVRHLLYAAPSKMVNAANSVCGYEDESSERGATEKDFYSAFKIVTLDDLNSHQVEDFATATGVSNTRPFLDAVERADAWSFTTRPQDLLELVEYWNDQARIGSGLELMRNSIDRRLSERDQDRADARPLSNERARLGAKLLAAASTLSRQQTIRVPDRLSDIKGLSIKDVLPDWTDLECATLLARPIFDEAVYGTVRFHHRSVRDYLTAEWFNDLLKQETSRHRIEDLFFRHQYGMELAVPAMRPILPWLSIFDEKIRSRVGRVAPEVLFEGGDPSQLPLETRRQILQQVCDQRASWVSNLSMDDHAAVQRFATSDLTEDIKELIRKFASNDDVLRFLLQMVWQGELVGALPDAMFIALSPASGRYVRTVAFRAVSALGSAKDNAELRRSFVDESTVLDRDWLAELVDTAEPSTETMAWLFECLRKVDDKNPHSVDHLTEQLSQFVKRADPTLLGSFVERANALLEEPPVVERRHCEVSTRFMWLMKIAARVVERLAKARDTSVLAPFALAILHKLPISLRYDPIEFSGIKVELGDLVPKWPQLNLALFWYLVEQQRQWLDRKTNERLTDCRKVDIWTSYVRFSAQDFGLVLKEVIVRPLLDDKMIALSLAYSLYLEAGHGPAQRAALEKAVCDDPVLSAYLSELTHPPRQSAEAKRYKRMEAE